MKKLIIISLLCMMVALSACTNKEKEYQNLLATAEQSIDDAKARAYSDAIKLWPEKADAYIGLYEYYCEQGRYILAENALDDAVDAVESKDDIILIMKCLDELKEKKNAGSDKTDVNLKPDDSNAGNEVIPNNGTVNNGASDNDTIDDDNVKNDAVTNDTSNNDAATNDTSNNDAINDVTLNDYAGISLCSYDAETGKYLMENDKLRFEMDEINTQISLTNKENNVVWRSNEKSPIVVVEMKHCWDWNSSTYDTRSAVSNNEYSKLPTVIDTEPFIITSIKEDCIQVEYDLVNRDTTFIIPQLITEDRFNSFLDKLTEKEKKLVTEYYKKYDKDNLSAKDNYDELCVMYPAIKTDIIYVLRDVTKNSVKQKIADILVGAGYTEDDYKRDLIVSDYKRPTVRATVEYRLDNADFLVSVKNIEWDNDHFSAVNSVKILPGFGINAVEYSEIPMREEYIRIPENYMTDIHFNELFEVNSMDFYPDTYKQTEITTVKDMANNYDFYPYFGVTHNSQTFICCPEKYLSSALIYCKSDFGTSTNYDDISWEYIFSDNEDEKGISCQKNTELSQRYIFINSDDAELIRSEYNNYFKQKNGNYPLEK
ncbi:MAG: hypothetical protein MJ131_01605 [Lachnospiraceae bacterium]|nr:hypothetical protein [Lachnospiraceae bacterium]